MAGGPPTRRAESSPHHDRPRLGSLHNSGFTFRARSQASGKLMPGALEQLSHHNLKGRQIRRIRNRPGEHIYPEPAIAPLCAGAHYFTNRRLYLCLTNTYPFRSDRTHLAHVISRPFRANRLFGCFPGLKPWAESYSPCGAKNIPNSPYLSGI